MLGVTAGPTPDPVAVAIEGSRQALQPWLNQNLRCQNLVRGGDDGGDGDHYHHD